jgi:hypothetical protein
MELTLRGGHGTDGLNGASVGHCAAESGCCRHYDGFGMKGGIKASQLRCMEDGSVGDGRQLMDFDDSRRKKRMQTKGGREVLHT